MPYRMKPLSHWMPIVAVALFLALAAPARGQVAVSSLVPVTPNLLASQNLAAGGFVTLNPAAMQWGAPSRFGIGYGEGDVKPESGDSTEFTGGFGGGRLVGETFSAAGEGTQLRDGTGPADFKADTMAGAVGARVFSPLTLGALYSAQDTRAGLVEANTTSWNVGGSYRFSEWLFVGGAYGVDSLSVTDETDPLETVKFDDERPVFTYGAGIRVAGSFRLHLEVYGVDRNAYEFRGVKFGDSDTTAGVAELGWGPIVLGVQAISVDQDVFGQDYTTRTQIYDVAWAPVLGLALGVHFERSEEELDDSGFKTDVELTALTLAYQF